MMQIRNLAIIAHVDHGKTRLTDALMQETGMLTDQTITMDSNDLERERGITIYSKNTSVFYKDTKINIVDTPGHADFGSEVERVLSSIDSVLLIVDAQEGPMPQTKFVLKKSLELGLKPIVVLNKIDKPAARPDWAHEKVLELFMDLGATDEQLDFTTVYTIAKEGIAKMNLTDTSTNLAPLLDTIIAKIPAAKADTTLPLLFQPFNLAYDNYLGRMGIGRIYQGSIKAGEKVFIKKSDGRTLTGSILKLFTFEGINRKEVNEAFAGDIVMISGLPDIYIGDTVCKDEQSELLPTIKIDEPTISLNFLVNNSPFAGREGKFVTTQQIKKRLEKELEVNVGLKIDFSSNDFFKVYGRGELHIAVLLENMRRENFEIQVSQPQVIIKEVNGIKHEPFEEVTIDIPESSSGIVIEKMSKRKGQMIAMNPEQNHMRLIYKIPTRGLLGYRNEFIVDTRGEGILCSEVIGFEPYVGEIEKRNVGSMISGHTGKVLAYALANLQDRGVMYVEPNVDIYEGQVIGNTAKGMDMTVNPIKGKQLTNMRASGSDDSIHLIPPMDLTLERGLEIMSEDEYLEITPKSVRLRKQALTETDRVRAGRKKA
ncbi:MAG: GTP-binding protein TypA [Candidatus Magasanikbacteria bacterium RIFCSPHIGHO2_01_FULL_33_34]|uniref:50S ribosomal subunit assembly factor BipA n=1 Tax=Candidatus Magasanikbacteria bacterium RIFCSPHIGHO2_01_FULL_33_34 TaxID=1798671 RepID=A0A1F6LHR6_9BACT|nr:MAG: GTP-binding protein TypA [Candidatus Magasanikbacteria bacterium RIFCSPHIGHO2_01_FULL_33_34]OGH65102.1 MAG: GTP-binding protein TypA [Candidatus Magasanikbacteria bacterium RIFCSPHIGHO2_02_FULL_33_17]OGH75354.1 MAG: GTP-binding protein TypA [Candidatus Magasanikbacteria bacterium RIFCSPLOWO2_01_FULL_33_34]